MNKKISVVMSTYNEPVEWVEKSIRSILNQTYDNIEVIVICDNPDNKGIVDLLNLIKEGDNRVVLHFNERNKGLIYSLNKAINLSSGEYIARMDADDISLPTRLSEQILYLEENHLDLCGCNALLFSEHGNLGLTNKLNSHEALEKLMVAGDIGIIHPTFLARRKVFVESGGYNPLALHAEDMEFIAHILSMGFRLGNNPKVLFKYRFSTNSVTRRNAFHLYTTISNINKAYKSFKNGGDYIFVNSIKF
ncbi:TPA: glycosyltransferase family 2 protein, partial [Mannheimia haemolytica]|nr:glycosyltransferase family 2 protein [Mannheimia haemolytica]